MLVMLLGQSRVFYSMSRDGLVPKLSSARFIRGSSTPWRWNLLALVLRFAVFAAFLPSPLSAT